MLLLLQLILYIVLFYNQLLITLTIIIMHKECIILKLLHALYLLY